MVARLIRAFGYRVRVMEIAERIRAKSTELTSAERRVAESILASPQAVGFGTVADLAESAGVGAASVVRFAAKVGYDGFSDLQASVQRDLVNQLRPAAERIKSPDDSARSDLVATEVNNVRATLDAVDDSVLEAVVARLSDLSRKVALISGEATRGVTEQFAHQLRNLRDDVTIIGGPDVSVRRDCAVLPVDSTTIVIDLRRYEQWVLDAQTALVDRGVWTAGITDSLLSPIAAKADAVFLVSAGSVGPFDSHVGTLAVLNLIVVGVARSLRGQAAERLSAIEQAWVRGQSLTDGGKRT